MAVFSGVNRKGSVGCGKIFAHIEKELRADGNPSGLERV
jgi:hypothetical protein